MNRLLDDMLTADEKDAIDRVLGGRNPRFDLLVELSGLDPSKDFRDSDLRYLNFCGADLRGYDFSHSDLRHCIRNENTKIDDSTKFEGALIEWIEVEAVPIVLQMQGVESAPGSEQRRELLRRMISEFGRTQHIVTYLVSAATRAKKFDDFLDFADYLPSALNEDQRKSLRETALRLLAKRVSRSKSRTRREKTAIFATDSIVNRLRSSGGSLSEVIYSNLAAVINSKNETLALKDMAFVEPQDLEAAIRLL
ncbi:hypothetical protein DXV76_12845 [Rhodobacteraceae bacterium CCMM004]|nr:hypothetical protein DXV76_12845 [Rhodobacteraceae bacterium CCMM004]